MENFLTRNLGEFTLGWFLLSVVFGGLFGAILKYVFQFLLPQSVKRKQKIDEKVRKYSDPLLQAASDVELRIQTLLSKGIRTDWLKANVKNELETGGGFLEDPTKGLGYFFLSTVYVFARYFAWVEILKREAGFLEFPRGKKSVDFYGILHRINNAFRYTDLWPASQGSQPIKDCTNLYRHVQSAIGEIMIVKRDKEADCISFREFVNQYKDESNDQFRFWLRNLMAYFEDLSDIDITNMDQVLSERREYRVFRLVAIQYWYFQLIAFLDPKFEKVQPRDGQYGPGILNLLPDSFRTAVIDLPAD